MAGVTEGRRVQVGFHAPCSEFGFVRPPVDVQLRFLRTRARWVLYAFAAPAARPALLAWLEAHGPERIQHTASPDSGVLRASFGDIPAKWDDLLSTYDVLELRVRATGQAEIVVEGDSAAIRSRLLVGVTAVHDVSLARLPTGLLTPLQHNMLRRAYEAGYYDVPKRVTLTDLAKELGASQASLSELLRRGEQRLVACYLRAQTALPADLFDESAAWSDARTVASEARP